MRRRSVLIAVLVLIALALASCGGGSSGKALAQDAVKAMEAKDEARLKEIGNLFDELSAIQKARFAAELAQHGEEMGEAIQGLIDFKLGQ